MHVQDLVVHSALLAQVFTDALFNWLRILIES
jgi:hypothetical protein